LPKEVRFLYSSGFIPLSISFRRYLAAFSKASSRSKRNISALSSSFFLAISRASSRSEPSLIASFRRFISAASLSNFEDERLFSPVIMAVKKAAPPADRRIGIKFSITTPLSQGSTQTDSNIESKKALLHIFQRGIECRQ